MAEIHSPLANFSQDLRPIARMTALGLWAGAGLGAAVAIWLIIGAMEMREDAAASARIQEKLTEQLAQARERASSAPPPAAFRALRSRIERLNVLDFAGSASTAKLFDALEGLLPPRVALTALDYDRGKRTVEMVAVSESSEDLTSLYDVLDRHHLFVNVRLLDKKQAAGALASQVQVHLNFQLRDSADAKAAEEAAKAGKKPSAGKEAPASKGAS
jgi:Tfp pilus assembly protein PilN